MLTEEVEHILEDEEDGDLHSLLLPRREGHLPGRHAEVLSHRVEEPDLQGPCVSFNPLAGRAKLHAPPEAQS